jgi:hypothetical protein
MNAEELAEQILRDLQSSHLDWTDVKAELADLMCLECGRVYERGERPECQCWNDD